VKTPAAWRRISLGKQTTAVLAAVVRPQEIRGLFRLPAVAPADMPAVPDQLLTNDCRVADGHAGCDGHDSERINSLRHELRAAEGFRMDRSRRQTTGRRWCSPDSHSHGRMKSWFRHQRRFRHQNSPQRRMWQSVDVRAWVTVQADAWRLHLKIEKGLRFPSVDRQIPAREFCHDQTCNIG
jgi:hypothetical protein